MNSNLIARKTRVNNVLKDKTGRVISFEIDRRKWGRGPTGENLMAFNIAHYPEQKVAPLFEKIRAYLCKEPTDPEEIIQEVCMCCLGIYLRACGVKPLRLEEASMPNEVYTETEINAASRSKVLAKTIPEQAKWLLDKQGFNNSIVASKLAGINDDTKDSMTDVKREKAIIKHFAEQGITVTFTN